MTKDEILAASDEQLNELCATEIMGWTKIHNPYPDAYGMDWADATGEYASVEYPDLSDAKYAPTTNVSQAIGLLDYLHATKTLDDWGITRFPRYYICGITCPHPSIPKQILAINHAHKEMCRAIVFACLLMVAELEQQTAAGDAAQEGADETQ